MIVMGFFGKNFFIGLIIGLIISSVINATIGLLISKVVGFVVGFLYDITDSSRNINRKINYWRKNPVYIKVNQLQEAACQKYMHMSIAEFDAKKFNAGFGKNRRISDLLKLSEQKPTVSLEQLIDIYYSGLFRQVIIERIFDLSAELTKLKRSNGTENNKCPAEIMNRLHCCENSLEKLIDDADNMSDLELLERVSEASDIFHALCKELEEIKNKEKLEAERLKKENLQISSSSPMTVYKKLTYNRTMSNMERKYYYQFMTLFTDAKLIKIVVALGRIITTRYYEYYLEDFHESYKNKEKELLSLEEEIFGFYQKIITGEMTIQKFMDNYFNKIYRKLEKLAALISDWMDIDKERMSFEIKKENFEFYGMIVNELIEPIEAINVDYRFIDDIFETTQYFFAVENNIKSLKKRYNILCKLLDCPENKDRVQMVSDIDAEYKILNKKLFGKESKIMVHKF